MPAAPMFPKPSLSGKPYRTGFLFTFVETPPPQNVPNSPYLGAIRICPESRRSNLLVWVSLGSLRLFPVPGWERGRVTAEERRGTQRSSEVKSFLRSLRSLRLRKKTCKRHGLGASGGRALLNLHRKERKMRKDSVGAPGNARLVCQARTQTAKDPRGGGFLGSTHGPRRRL